MNTSLTGKHIALKHATKYMEWDSKMQQTHKQAGHHPRDEATKPHTHKLDNIQVGEAPIQLPKILLLQVQWLLLIRPVLLKLISNG
jgi:hypothetical protein